MPNNFLECYGDCTGPLDFPMKSADAKELETILDTGEYSPIKKFHNGFEAFLPGENADVSVISVEEVDRDGEVVLADGLDFSQFQKNPVVTYNHNYTIPPVGKSLWQKRVSNLWKAKTQYARRPENHPKDAEWFPDTIFHMVKDGMMSGKSIGGLKKTREATNDERVKYPGVKRIVEKALLFEYAVVPIGCCPSAITEAISKSLLKLPEEILKKDFKEVWEVVKDFSAESEDDEPEILIKEFTTAADYKRQQELRLTLEMNNMLKTLPEEVDRYLRRKMGKVS